MTQNELLESIKDDPRLKDLVHLLRAHKFNESEIRILVNNVEQSRKSESKDPA